MILKKWLINESKKRPQSEKQIYAMTMGAECVALEESPRLPQEARSQWESLETRVPDSHQKPEASGNP